MLEDAVNEYEYLTANPVSKRYRPRVPRKEREFLRPEESRRLLAESRSDFIGPAIWIGILAGLRPSEIQALRFRNIDFDRKVILIRESFKRKVKRIESFPKQKDWGSAPMTDDLATYLAERKGSPDDFVASGKFGGMLKYEILLSGLKRLCQKAGVRKISPHELRHSCTELYVEAGASAEDLRRLLNQSSLQATQRYIHRTDERLRSIAGQVRIGGAEPPIPSKLKLIG
jgi:integrase